MFNDKYGLTQAVLNGTKTQTRRVITEKLLNKINTFQEEYYNASLDYLEGKDLIEAYFINFPEKYPYKIGETIAIAQSYKDLGYKKKQYTRKEDSGYGYLYSELIDEIPMPWPINGFSNKMFVKPELMLHQICITNMRVERLQDISDEDCLKEGIEEFSTHSTASGKVYTFHGVNESYKTPREAYASLIDKVSRKGTWESNPYVFVYDFKLIE